MGWKDLLSRKGGPKPQTRLPNGWTPPTHPGVPTNEPVKRPTPPSPGRPAPSSASNAQWVPFGTDVTVGGRTIPGGGFYIGSGLKAPNGYATEPALIDPALKINWDRPDWAGQGMDYWPSYDRIPPTCRAAYLSWLGSDRSHADVCIGYVFLYFYGFERRILLDSRLRADAPDLEPIEQEVRRLAAIYGTNNSFRSYSRRLLDLIEGIRLATTTDAFPPPEADYGRSWEIPLPVRIATGRYVAAGMPIPPEWARAWITHHPEWRRRTPATRCPHEFSALFAMKYRAKFGDGLVVKPPKAMVKISYQAASSGFMGRFEGSFGNLPDISALTGPRNKLNELATDSSDALDALSRYLGRNPDGAGSPGAIALLPTELLLTHGGEHVAALRSWLISQTAPGAQPATWTEVAARCGFSPAKLAKADAVAVASLLGKLGAGIEPDVRFGASTPGPTVPAMLFTLPAGAADNPSPAYKAAATLVHLAAVVASAEGGVTAEESQRLERHLETVLGLDDGERTRLEAHLRWLVASRAGLGGLKKRIEALDVTARTAIGRFLVNVAAADGIVSPAEITTLIKIYKLLNLSANDVYSAVHGYGITDLGPVPVTDAASPTPRWNLPAPAPEQPAELVGLRLDPAKIEARVAETAAVSRMLADIFAEEEEPAPLLAPTPTSVEPADTLFGLDAAHSSLLRAVLCAGEWTRADLEDRAAGLGIALLGPAVDRINEAALEACGEPLLEGDDPFELNTYAVEELFEHA